MHIKIVRKTGNSKFTEGRMYIDGEFECFTIEDAIRAVKIPNETAIPKGTYNVIMTMSTRFGKVMPLLENVPNFTGVRIHSGNSSKDTEGCIIVGTLNDSMDDDFIGASKIAVSRLYPKIADALAVKETVTLEIA
jgi:hypothetical protein